MTISLVALFLLLAVPASVFAQMETPPPASGEGNATLRKLVVGTVIASLDTFGGAAWEDWSSSYLKAEGSPPAKPKKTGNEDQDFELEYDYAWAYDKWQSMYSPRQLTDDSSETCWVEGVAGSGIGEVVIVKVDADKPVQIQSGYQKNAGLYERNARPAKVRLFVLQATQQGITQWDIVYMDIKTLAAGEYVLKDVMDWQPLPMPAYKPILKPRGKDEDWSLSTQTFVAIQILSVYPGSKYEDTCISGVRNKP